MSRGPGAYGAPQETERKRTKGSKKKRKKKGKKTERKKKGKEERNFSNIQMGTIYSLIVDRKINPTEGSISKSTIGSIS